MLAAATMIDASALNGDRALSRAEREAYIAFHQQRNAGNTQRSIAEGCFASPGPIAHASHVHISPEYSPSRTDLQVFFAYAASRIAQRFAVSNDPLSRLGSRPLTILDLGCGSGVLAPILASAGLCGRYIGLDIKRHPKWIDGYHASSAELRRELIVADIASFDASTLPTLDCILSSTALEHIEDDAGAIAKLSARLAPWGVQAHVVPGELGLRVYGPHGWRQYSPRCLRQLFPTAQIFRYGGPSALRVHERCITQRIAQGKIDGRTAHPRMYERAVTKARALDARASSRGGTLMQQSVLYAALVCGSV